MKTRFNPCISLIAISAAALLAASTTVRATDYNFGTITGPFTITATDTARAMGNNLGTFNDNGTGGVYWRGSATDATYAHFNLAPLAGATINGDVSLNFPVWAYYGGNITNGEVSTPNAAWSYPGSTPGFTAIAGSPLLNGNFSDNALATWTISNATFQGFVNFPSTFFGLLVSAGSGSTAHFSGLPTLTGTADSVAVKVTGGTDWSTAVWNSGTSTLAISGTSDVSGGDVSVFSGVTLSVTDSATLGAGNFSGTIATLGTLSFGGSANQTLAGNITGVGALAKSGAGTLTLSGTNSTFNGGITITGGTLEVAANTFGTGAVTIENGGTLHVINGGHWNFGGGNPYGASTNFIPSVTVKEGGALDLGGSAINGISNLYLDGGSVTGGGGYYEIGVGALFLFNGNEQITAGGATTSTIASSIGLNQNNNTITVDASSTLEITGVMKNSYWWGGDSGGFIKAGDGTLTLSNTNTYSGTTTVNGGTLQLDNINSLPATTTLSVNGGTAYLNYSGNIAIAGLKLNGVTQTDPGTYGSSASGADHPDDTYFSGDGTVSIGPVPLHVTYNGNGNTGGSAPVDGNTYTNGNTVTVLDNTGGLTKTGYTFSNWNTEANGGGTSYDPDDTFAITLDTTLYAQWAYTPATWGAATALTGNDADVATSGTFVYGYTESDTAATVNGVTFAAGNSTTSLGGGNVTLDGFQIVYTYPFNEGLYSGEYANLIKGGVLGGSSPSNAEVTLNNLTPGNQYLVQILMADFRYYGTSSETLDGQVTLQCGNGTGQSATGTFTAGSASQIIKLYGNLQINALQVRDVTGGIDYDNWKSANGVIGGENDDDDNDGLTNHEEYAFGLDPTGGSSVNPITALLDKTTGKFTYNRRKPSLGTNLTYSVWFSTNLATWTQDTDATEGTPVPNGDNETVEVTLSALPGVPLPPKLFIQVRAN